MLSSCTIKTYAIFLFVAGIFNPLKLGFYGLNLYFSDVGLIVLLVLALLGLAPSKISTPSKGCLLYTSDAADE